MVGWYIPVSDKYQCERGTATFICFQKRHAERFSIYWYKEIVLLSIQTQRLINVVYTVIS